MSFNVWFELHEQSRRMRSIAALADSTGGVRPAVLALQELTPTLRSYLWPPLEAAGFHAPLLVQPESESGFNGQEPYGVGLATRPPLSPLRHAAFRPYRESMMGRGLARGVAAWGDLRIALGSTHLESFIGEEHQHQVLRIRRQQLGEAARMLLALAHEQRCHACMLLGDLNWDDGKDGDALAAAGDGWQDAFIAAGRPRGTAATSYKWRFDRCLFRAVPTMSSSANASAAAADALLSVTGFALAGKEQGPLLEGRTFVGRNGSARKLFPSDHRGIVTSFAGHA